MNSSGGNPEMGSQVLAGDVLTNYHDMGNGLPVVFLHGSGPGVSAWANWRLNLAAVAERHRAIAPDLVGFGFTERPDDISYNLETWKRHLSDFLEALGLERVALVGNSFGGAVALAFAACHPERVERLAVMGTAGLSFPLTEALEEIWGYNPSVERMEEMLGLLVHDRTLLADDLAVHRYEASVRPGMQRAYSAMFAEPRQHALEALSTSEDEIRRIEQEVLIIHGREDVVVPYSVSRRLFELIDRAQLHIFGGCGHSTQIEHAARFNRLLLDFFDEQA